MIGSLNTVIKPLLNQVKQESNGYIQKLAAKATVTLLTTLFAQ